MRETGKQFYTCMSQLILLSQFLLCSWQAVPSWMYIWVFFGFFFLFVIFSVCSSSLSIGKKVCFYYPTCVIRAFPPLLYLTRSIRSNSELTKIVKLKQKICTKTKTGANMLHHWAQVRTSCPLQNVVMFYFILIEISCLMPYKIISKHFCNHHLPIHILNCVFSFVIVGVSSAFQQTPPSSLSLG